MSRCRPPSKAFGMLVALAGHCAAAYRAGVQEEDSGPVQTLCTIWRDCMRTPEAPVLQ